jgi:hypothetical protein
MKWRDLIVTSKTGRDRDFEDIEELRFHQEHQSLAISDDGRATAALQTAGKRIKSLNTHAPDAPTGNFEDIEDFGPRYENESFLSLEDSLQNSKQQKTSPISSKPILAATTKEFPPSAPAEVDQTTQEPLPPLSPGWLVAYRDSAGRLCGGCDDRERGTVAACAWDGQTWLITLTSGDALPIRQVVSVGKTDGEGRVTAAWLVNTHGYDGEGLHP